MKQFLSLVLAAIIIGAILFAAAYWIFSIEYKTSMMLGVVAAFSGLIVELIKPLLVQKKNN